MLEDISSKDLFQKIFLWRKKFLWITIAAFIVSATVATLMPKQYKSTTVLFPARQFAVTKLVIEANAGNQEDYMMFGDADDAEKIMQLLLCDELKMRVADHLDLWKKWNLKDTVFKLHYLKLKWEDMVTIKRTEFNSIRIEAYNYTASDAAFLANAIADYADTLRYYMNREISGKIVKIVKDEYNMTVARMKEMEDSMQILRTKYHVLHYKEQVKAYTKEYAKAISKNDETAKKRLEEKLTHLELYGGAYQNMKDNLEKYGSKYPDIKMKYDEALVNYRSQIPLKFVAEHGVADEFKARPKRLVIVSIAVLAANILGLFVLLFRERFAKDSGK